MISRTQARIIKETMGHLVINVPIRSSPPSAPPSFNLASTAKCVHFDAPTGTSAFFFSPFYCLLFSSCARTCMYMTRARLMRRSCRTWRTRVREGKKAHTHTHTHTYTAVYALFISRTPTHPTPRC